MTQPGPGCILSPAGALLKLTCSAAEGFIITSWSVHLPDRPEPVVTNELVVRALMDRGITVKNLRTQMSELIFNGHENNNNTIVRCTAANVSDALTSFSSEEAKVIIYGKAHYLH